MKITILKRGILAISSAVALSVFVPALAFAQPAEAHELKTQAQERRETTQQSRKTAEVQPESSERRIAAQTKLKDTKLKACQNRQESIQNILTRLSTRGEKQLEVFTKISDRTQAFYVTKSNTLDNYDALVADVVAKKAAATKAVTAAHDSAHEFKCDGDNPKGVASTFKVQLKAQNAALKEYKTSVKNLIVGVKSVQSTANRTESTQ